MKNLKVNVWLLATIASMNSISLLSSSQIENLTSTSTSASASLSESDVVDDQIPPENAGPATAEIEVRADAVVQPPRGGLFSRAKNYMKTIKNKHFGSYEERKAIYEKEARLLRSQGKHDEALRLEEKICTLAALILCQEKLQSILNDPKHFFYDRLYKYLQGLSVFESQGDLLYEAGFKITPEDTREDNDAYKIEMNRFAQDHHITVSEALNHINSIYRIQGEIDILKARLEGKMSLEKSLRKEFRKSMSEQERDIQQVAKSAEEEYSNVDWGP